MAFVRSFAGKPVRSKNILRYVSSVYGPQKMDREREVSILRLLKMSDERAIMFFPVDLASKKMHVDTNERGRVTLPTFRPKMRRYLRALHSPLPHELLKRLPAAILVSMLFSDYRFVSSSRPRRFNDVEEDNLWKDPHFSFIVTHFIRGESTKIPVYDEMFEKMREFFRRETIIKNRIWLSAYQWLLLRTIDAIRER